MESWPRQQGVNSEWISTNILADSFNLSATLNSGQAFRWVKGPNSLEFVGVIGDRVWRLRQTSSGTPVAFHRSCATTTELELLRTRGQIPQPLVSYFRLDTFLDDLFSTWLDKDHLLREFFSSSVQGINRFKGLRLLNQDPREAIFAFITSSNNNVPRISKLLIALSVRYGKKMWSHETVSVYSFPTLEVLARPGTEVELRKIGFGYRAKFIPAVARKLIEAGGDAFLAKLRVASYEECKTFLLDLPGIGNKVADCICLSCLNKVEVVPVDVHISRAAALRGVRPPTTTASSSSLSSTAYRHISQGLSELWHPFAGWAQVIVFFIHLHGQSNGTKRTNTKSKSKKEAANSGAATSTSDVPISLRKRARHR
ncbi:N glycosylase:DNA lyase [Echinococcus multilocularis]|uniref:DNA-(apurinic or apyrimidinic site) lyase n=1 Tax=Echinococcus multilocularis TaxID=6211 RepID=A0A068YEB1_ECHMU|nr:N glycosylase:DNA lyase [Echinococcus multilocularis]